MLNLLLILSCLLTCFSGCFYKQESTSYSVCELKDSSLYIQMPKNIKVFKNIGPMVYDEFWEHFQRVGYNLKTGSSARYALHLIVRKLEIPMRFVSPDIVPYMNHARVEILVELVDTRMGARLMSRPFQASRWVSRPSDPVFEDAYFDHEFRKLLYMMIPRIEHQVRKVLYSSQV
jgi:hypothetical protein